MTSPTEREVLEALFTKLHDGKSARWLDYYGEPGLSAKGRRFNALMGLNAYLDAALMLVPEGWFVYGMGEKVSPIIYKGDLHNHLGFWAEIQIRQGGHLSKGEGATPALALCAAIARNGE